MYNKTLYYNYYVYIITNKENTIFYIGVTNNLERRMYEHKERLVKGFSHKHNLNKLIYYEYFDNINDAIAREKQLKNWHRDWKINLIKKENPEFKDLLNPETPKGVQDDNRNK
ncbi:MAG: GIY-YIG nuclease family protein [Patescibacteria group bacterium]